MRHSRRIRKLLFAKARQRYRAEVPIVARAETAAQGHRTQPDFGREGAIIQMHACALGCEGIVSKRLASPYSAGRSARWLNIKNLLASAAKRKAEEEWR